MTYSGLTPLDGFALAWFLACWFGYTRYADHGPPRRRTTMAVIAVQRRAWMRQMLLRENRVLDSTLVGNLMRSIGFFASTTLLILGGLIAVLGGTDKAISLLADLPLVAPATRLAFDAKVLLLLFVFVYAFFKFTWSLRVLNYCSVLIGAAPPPPAEGPEAEAHADKAAQLNILGARHFTRGLRAYYFGLAALSWFLHPLALILAAGWVVLVLYRREFKSRTLKVMTGGGPEAGA